MEKAPPLQADCKGFENDLKRHFFARRGCCRRTGVRDSSDGRRTLSLRGMKYVRKLAGFGIFPQPPAFLCCASNRAPGLDGEIPAAGDAMALLKLRLGHLLLRGGVAATRISGGRSRALYKLNCGKTCRIPFFKKVELFGISDRHAVLANAGFYSPEGALAGDAFRSLRGGGPLIGGCGRNCARRLWGPASRTCRSRNM